MNDKIQKASVTRWIEFVGRILAVPILDAINVAQVQIPELKITNLIQKNNEK